jgi:enoyl-[acyl-carrier protein] reductase III
MRVDLRGKNAFVTGGSGDIGRAICVALGRAGARVAFTYFSDRDGAAATEAAISAEAASSAEATTLVLRANLADDKSTATLIRDVREQLGRIDIFINNAASGVLAPLAELKPRHFQWTMDINARALLTLTQALLIEPPLMARGGRIIALSSLGAVRAIPQYTVVGASKAALESLARHLSLELGPLGINMNVISPGIVDTKALAYFPNRELLLDVAGQRTPIGRLATPADIADVALFLCSDAAAMIHGQTIHVDGGYSVVA